MKMNSFRPSCSRQRSMSASMPPCPSTSTSGQSGPQITAPLIPSLDITRAVCSAERFSSKTVIPAMPPRQHRSANMRAVRITSCSAPNADEPQRSTVTGSLTLDRSSSSMRSHSSGTSRMIESNNSEEAIRSKVDWSTLWETIDLRRLRRLPAPPIMGSIGMKALTRSVGRFAPGSRSTGAASTRFLDRGASGAEVFPEPSSLIESSSMSAASSPACARNSTLTRSR